MSIRFPLLICLFDCHHINALIVSYLLVAIIVLNKNRSDFDQNITVHNLRKYRERRIATPECQAAIAVLNEARADHYTAHGAQVEQIDD
jgi:hypothetical protein